MTAEELDELIASVGPMAERALGKIHAGILEAAEGKLQEASEKDSKSDEPQPIKLSIPLRVVIRLDLDPPKCYIDSAAARQWKARSYPDEYEPDEPKSDAERAKAYRDRQRSDKATHLSGG